MVFSLSFKVELNTINEEKMNWNIFKLNTKSITWKCTQSKNICPQGHFDLLLSSKYKFYKVQKRPECILAYMFTTMVTGEEARKR